MKNGNMEGMIGHLTIFPNTLNSTPPFILQILTLMLMASNAFPIYLHI